MGKLVEDGNRLIDRMLYKLSPSLFQQYYPEKYNQMTGNKNEFNGFNLPVSTKVEINLSDIK